MTASTLPLPMQEGIKAARTGYRLLSRLHLSQTVEAEPGNELGWLWMAWVAESPAAAVAHLERVLELNPKNEIARAGITWAKTMAEWDFANPMSPSETLRAVAERESIAPIDLPASRSASIEAPAAFQVPAPVVVAEEAPPIVAEKPQSVGPANPFLTPSLPWRDNLEKEIGETTVVADTSAIVSPRPPSQAEIDLGPPVELPDPNLFEFKAASSHSMGDFELPSATVPEEVPQSVWEDLPPVKPKSESRSPLQPQTFDEQRPESLPIDAITGQFLGEGKPLNSNSFSAFEIQAEKVKAVKHDETRTIGSDASAPVAGSQVLGKIEPASKESAKEALSNSVEELSQAINRPTQSLEHLRDEVDEYRRQNPEVPLPQVGKKPAAPTPTPRPPSQPEIRLGSTGGNSGGESDFEMISSQADTVSAQAQANTAVNSRAEAGPSAEFIDLTASSGDIAASQASAWSVGTSGGPKKRVLIVDDSPTVCKIVSLTLKKRGFDVSTASDGVEAMSVIAVQQPDVILLDITMPRMDGYQLCKLIKGYPQTKQIPVIMLSGKDGFFDKVRGKLVGCSDYITKPFDPEQLVATVERFLVAQTGA